MNISVLLASLGVFAPTIIVMPSMHLHFPFGVILFAYAPARTSGQRSVYDFGWVSSVLSFAGFVTMYPTPIRYYWRRRTGGEVVDLFARTRRSLVPNRQCAGDSSQQRQSSGSSLFSDRRGHSDHGICHRPERHLNRVVCSDRGDVRAALAGALPDLLDVGQRRKCRA